MEPTAPPFFAALMRFAAEAETSWHTPGHMAGAAFAKSAPGRAFRAYFGENLLHADLSVSVAKLGSLLDHSGPIGEAETFAAQVFGAQRTYFGTNGTSTANRIVMMASVARGQRVLADRNCHKSIEHGLALTGAEPVYLLPKRNHLGLIGPIPPAALREAAAQKAALAVITNATYDGLCYNAPKVEALLAPAVDRFLFDEAWFAHARFHPLYANHFAMRGDPADHTGPTVFATQSTHKLLAALSQASMIHLREGRAKVEHARFNEVYMMHASTSPQYAILASADVSTAMMAADGERLLGEALGHAIGFRQEMARRRITSDWFFAVWQKPGLHSVPAPELAQDQSAWSLEPGAAWHGFGGLEPDFCMLDPLKVTVVMPGGGTSSWGIPAALVAAYLAEYGIVAEKTESFFLLFLFTLGVAREDWERLVAIFAQFKRDYDANAPLTHAMPRLVAAHPQTYAGLGLRDLAQTMFQGFREVRLLEGLQAAHAVLPARAMTPAEAHDRLVRGEGVALPLAALAGGVAATSVVPYPPGIPLLMPGERFGPADGPVLRYLAALQALDSRFPGFVHETHGVSAQDGVYTALCLNSI